MKNITITLILLVLAGSLFSQIKYVNHIKAKDPGRCVISKNGKFLYLECDQGLAVYEINQKTGGLIKKQTIKELDDLEFTSSAISPDDNYLYVQYFVRNPNEINAIVRVYACNNKSGELKLVSTLTNAKGKKFEYNSKVELSPQGNFLFVTSNSHKTLHIFKRNSSTGSLMYLNTHTSATLGMYSNIVMSPDEHFMYVFSPNIFRACYVYEFDKPSGGMNEIQEVENPNYSSYNSDALLISPDGKNVYTIGSANNIQRQIGQYQRDVSSGLLTFEHDYNNLQSHGVVDISFLYMDGSGDHLFATTSFGDRLHGMHAFKRNASTGDISFQQSIVDKAPTDKLKGAFIMGFSKNNKFIYLTAARDHALNIFENPKYKPSITISE